jgi:hypothetical protein
LETSTLGGELLWGFGFGCGLVYSRRVEASSDVVVASMECLKRGCMMVEHLEEGYKTHKALQWRDRWRLSLKLAHKSLSLECTKESVMAVIEA